MLNAQQVDSINIFHLMPILHMVLKIHPGNMAPESTSKQHWQKHLISEPNITMM